ncbi:hypothetical protein AOLI_G00011760 [Acnodon oligacanthus]
MHQLAKAAAECADRRSSEPHEALGSDGGEMSGCQTSPFQEEATHALCTVTRTPSDGRPALLSFTRSSLFKSRHYIRPAAERGRGAITGRQVEECSRAHAERSALPADATLRRCSAQPVKYEQTKESLSERNDRPARRCPSGSPVNTDAGLTLQSSLSNKDICMGGCAVQSDKQRLLSSR